MTSPISDYYPDSPWAFWGRSGVSAPENTQAQEAPVFIPQTGHSTRDSYSQAPQPFMQKLLLLPGGYNPSLTQIPPTNSAWTMQVQENRLGQVIKV